MPSIPPKPTQLEPTPSPQAARNIHWMARLASETEKRMLLSIVTTIASGAPAHVRSRLCGRRKLRQHVAILHDDELPGLAVTGAAGHAACFQDASHYGVRDGLVLVAAYGEEGANSVEDFHVQDSFPDGARAQVRTKALVATVSLIIQ